MDDCEEEDSLARKSLGIFEDISGYNPNECPTNGFEYLHQVICENSKLPQTVVADIDLDNFKTKQTVYVIENKQSSVNFSFLPSQEWQRLQIRDFTQLKEKVSRMKEIWSDKRRTEDIHVPDDINNEKYWVLFCQESPPLMQILFTIQQAGITKLLNFFSLWLTDQVIDFSQNTTVWLYSLFASLEEPLWPSTVSDIRDIVRMAREKRSQLESPKDDVLIPLNLIICIGARYFRQTDLCD